MSNGRTLTTDGPFAETKEQLGGYCLIDCRDLDEALKGLTTREIARAFLSAEPAIAQRLVRAKQKIREAAIPFRVPAASQLPRRLEAVLAAVYLVFNEGYTSTGDAELVRDDLCAEAVRLARSSALSMS